MFDISSKRWFLGLFHGYYTDISLLLGKYTRTFVPWFPGIPKMLHPKASGNITSRDSREPRDKHSGIFPEKQWNNCYVTFYLWKRLKNRSEILGATAAADSRDVMNNIARTVKCPSLFQSDVLSIPKISAVNITFAVPAMSGQYNVMQYLAC